MTTLTIPVRTGDFILSESNRTQSRESITVLGGAGNLASGTVLGLISQGDVTAAAGSNTGNGTCTPDATTPRGNSAQVGDYTLSCTVATTGSAAATGIAGSANTGNATIGTVTPTTSASLGLHIVIFTGATAFNVFSPLNALIAAGSTGVAFASGGLGFTITAGNTPCVAGDCFFITVTDNNKCQFSVTAPDGTTLAAATVGTTYNTDHLKFALAQGLTKFIVGDSFTITVDEGSGKYKTYDDDNRDGSQTATCILYTPVDASSDDQSALAIVRNAEVDSAKLIWAATNDSGDKTAGITDLAARGILVRT